LHVRSLLTHKAGWAFVIYMLTYRALTDANRALYSGNIYCEYP